MPIGKSQYGKFANGRSGREIGTSVKERTKVRRINCFIILLGFLLGSVVLFHETVLTEAGGFLAPEGRGEAQVVIVEGAGLRKERAVDAAIRMLSSGKANPLLVVDRASAVEQTFDWCGNRLMAGELLTRVNKPDN
jgi:hypothetical protein